MMLGRVLGTACLVVVALVAAPAAAEQSYETIDNAPSKAEIAEKVRDLFDDFFAWRLEDNPEFATQLGIHKYDANLSSYSMESNEYRWNRCQELLEQLEVTEAISQSFTDKINMEILREGLKTYIRGFNHLGFLFPVSYLDGVGTSLALLIGDMKFNTEQDYRNLITRLQKFPQQAGEIQTLMEKGINETRTLHNISMYSVPEQFRALDMPVEKSPFYEPFLEMPPSISADVQEELREEARRVIREDVIQSYKDLADFIETDYLPHTRPKIAATSLPNGDNYYAECLRFHTSTDLTPDQIHQIGLDEVERIEADMRKVVEELGLNMTLQQFSDKLRTDPANYYDSPQELIDGFTTIIRDRIGPKMLTVVLEMPKLEVIVDVLPENQKDGLSASYNIPAFDGSRPGKFKINQHQYDKQAKYEMAALSAHEANPGHHYYFSYLVEKEGLPDFRRAGSDGPSYSEAPSGFPLSSAIVEGWGLYSEFLGHEMGLYEDPIDRYGRYSQEIFRACRLVVDTGIHAFNWTQEQAVEFMLKHTASSRAQVEHEVRRYITWPGQACAYKIGELRLKELRTRAETELGELFDKRVFHKAILDCAGPLSVVEQCVQRYINAGGVWDAWGERTVPGQGQPTGGAAVPSAAAAALTAGLALVAAAALRL
ncbi:hypothetical protein FJT64_014656 [Amphibalanus amphitrite]|uniref:DUF885 domain-containing protein n=1 Tax=Amphibalanus amphitrite TaxID=1232801 RepID=A0A6A4V997_AMPAM|nr:hypothetical protein FJT64_014656 [Amphibalanus amphitrite]